jgi:hypothetical protein
LGIVGLLDDLLIVLICFLHVAAIYRSVLYYRHGGSWTEHEAWYVYKFFRRNLNMFSLIAEEGFFVYASTFFPLLVKYWVHMYLLIHVFFYIQNHRCSDCIDERVEISLLFDFDVAGLYMMKAYVVSSCSLFLDKYLLLPVWGKTYVWSMATVNVDLRCAGYQIDILTILVSDWYINNI